MTKFEWAPGHSLRLEQLDGVARAIYTDPAGNTHTFTGDGAMVTQPLMEETSESVFDRTVKWCESASGHFVVGKAANFIGAAGKWMGEAGRTFVEVKQVLTRAYTLVVTEPIAPDLPQSPPPTHIGQMVRELDSRAQGKKPYRSVGAPQFSLPVQAYQRDEATQQLVPASYEAPRVPCMREWKNNGIMAMVRFACAATPEDCQILGGHAFERRPDCSQWCDQQDDPRAVLASFDPATLQLACYQQQCNDEFVNGTFTPLKNEAACASGCAHDLCSGGLGACEIPTENAQGQRYIVCKENLTKGFCEAGPTPEAFQPGKKCSEVGYPYWNAGEGVWRMTPPATYDAGTPKLDGPQADAGAGTDAPRTDAGTDGGGSTTTKVCNGRFVIEVEGSPPPASCDNYSTNCTGSGRVKDTSTGLIWTRNELASVFRSDFTGATSKCSMIGMRVPTLVELRGVVPVACKDAVHWRAIPFMTSTDHPDPDPAWHWCVTYPGGKEDYCVNNVGLVCVKSP